MRVVSTRVHDAAEASTAAVSRWSNTLGEGQLRGCAMERPRESSRASSRNRLGSRRGFNTASEGGTAGGGKRAELGAATDVRARERHAEARLACGKESNGRIRRSRSPLETLAEVRG
jgi:hypothetical protein